MILECILRDKRNDSNLVKEPRGGTCLIACSGCLITGFIGAIGSAYIAYRIIDYLVK